MLLTVIFFNQSDFKFAMLGVFFYKSGPSSWPWPTSPEYSIMLTAKHPCQKFIRRRREPVSL
ncbi:hypothetical protein LDENG_00260520, partial [Lucifuga dentata]